MKKAIVDGVFVDANAYMMFGDIDKPFHRPECECLDCENWRVSKGRSTHAELQDNLVPLTVADK